MISETLTDIPYARPYWAEAEAKLLVNALNSGTWTNGEMVARFEESLEVITGVPTVTVSSGTAAAYALLKTIKRQFASSVLITPTLNFAAGPASAADLGWDIALCDVNNDDLTISTVSLVEILEQVADRYEQVVVLVMHYAGHACDMETISEICTRFGADLVEDACHAIGGSYSDGSQIGSWPTSLASYFSFHPTKPLACGEGGAIASKEERLITSVQSLRNHNMSPAPESNDDLAPRPYEIHSPGMNLRLSEFHAAVGLAQAEHLKESQSKRKAIVKRYRESLEKLEYVRIVPRLENEVGSPGTELEFAL